MKHYGTLPGVLFLLREEEGLRGKPEENKRFAVYTHAWLFVLQSMKMLSATKHVKMLLRKKSGQGF